MAKLYVGDAAIRGAIKRLGGRIEGVTGSIQDILVSIVTHANGEGNGDVSRALDLCKMLKRYPSINLAFVIGHLRAFAATSVNLRANDGAGKVSLIKGQKFDVDGAKANNWADAFDANGERAPWYQGPRPAEFKPMTIGDLAEDMRGFIKRELTKLNSGKLNGKTVALADLNEDQMKNVVPLVQLTDADRQAFEAALETFDRVANTLSRHEDIQQHLAAAKEAEAAAVADEEVVSIITPKPQEKAVA